MGDGVKEGVRVRAGVGGGVRGLGLEWWVGLG